MRFSIVLFVVLFIHGISACQSGKDQNAIVEMSFTDFREVYEEVADLQLVDVRTSEEYSAGYIYDADNVNFLEKDFLKKMESFDKEAPIYIYCQAGSRSTKAAELLLDAGYTKIYNLKEGYGKWE